MRHIGLFEAKTNLSKIAERVRRTGEAVTLTKRGEAVIDLVPHRTSSSRRSKAEVLAELEEISRELPKSSLKQLKEDIAQGRR